MWEVTSFVLLVVSLVLLGLWLKSRGDLRSLKDNVVTGLSEFERTVDHDAKVVVKFVKDEFAKVFG